MLSILYKRKKTTATIKPLVTLPNYMNYTWNCFPIYCIYQIRPYSDYYLFADIRIIEIYVIAETEVCFEAKDKLLYEKSI